MAGEVTQLPSFSPNVEEEQSATRKRAESITDPLTNMLQKMTTHEPLQRSSPQPSFESGPGIQDHACHDLDEAVEFNTIISKINHRLRLEKKDGAIEEYYTLPDGSQHTKHANSVSQTLDELRKYSLPFAQQEVEMFISRHEDLLPNGRKTCPNLMRRIMTDMLFIEAPTLQETNTSSEVSVDDSWTLAKTIQELREIVAFDKNAEKDLLSLVMVESEVSKFYTKHAWHIRRKAPPKVLRRAAIDLRVELIQKKEGERVSKEKREREDLASAIATFRRYHQLKSEGKSVADAMRIIASKAPFEDKNKTGHVLSAPAPPSTLREIDSEVVEMLDVDQNVASTMDKGKGIDRQPESKEDDVDMLSTSEDESIPDGIWRTVSHSDVPEVDVEKSRGRTGSPTKRRAVSAPRTTSPPKKGKVSPTKQVKYFPTTPDSSETTPKKKTPTLEPITPTRKIKPMGTRGVARRTPKKGKTRNN